MEDEQAVWEGQPSQIVNLGTFALCFFFAWLIVPVVIAVSRFLDVQFTRYRVTAETLEVTTGVLSRRIEQIELYRVKDLSVEQPLLLRPFGLGNLTLRSSDRSTPVVKILAIRDCLLLRDRLRGLVEKRRDEKKVRELDF